MTDAAALEVAFRHDVPWFPEVIRGPADFMLPAAHRSLDAEPLWKPFVRAVAGRKPVIAKAQLAGPGAIAAYGAGRAPLQEKATRMARELKAAGTTPWIVFDEPLTSAPSPELPALLAAVRREGALTGLHCCAQAPWAEVLALDLDVVSFDARLSLDAVLATGFRGRLCLGVTPELQLDAALLRRSLISPPCGLGLETLESMARVLTALSERHRGQGRP
jgi:hypothetical protein